MRMYDIIAKKRDNKKLEKEEIDYVIKNYSKDLIKDYQMSALLMAIYLNGMDMEEITNLTIAMGNSSDKYDLSKIGKCIVDKHSTGGVGDKVTLIVLPIVASLFVPIAKMSGRGLGFTGGTIDKLESIKGFNVNIPYNQFITQVKDINIALISQSKDIAIADKKMYALRDTTATVSSTPLIASSIMSKKIASGADKIILDVTCGKGAFMKTIEEAKKLAKLMVDIGKLAERETIAVVTNMEEPLGKKVGNRLEIEEVIEFLKADNETKINNISEDLKEVVFTIGSYMIALSGKGDNIEENKQKMLENILNGKAYNKFIQFIQAQGGIVSNDDNIMLKERASKEYIVKSNKEGYIQEIDGEKIGNMLVMLGGGRNKKEDIIDYGVGFEFIIKTGDYVKENSVICKVLYNDEEKLEEIKSILNTAIVIENNIVKQKKHVLDIIR